ncbi:MAG: hypothetical protein WCB46_05445 [Methanoregula sp.]
MARLNDDAQWIILMGFLVSFSLFFLAMVINQSTVVGQTTAESVIEFPKNDIRDVRTALIYGLSEDISNVDEKKYPNDHIGRDITIISLSRKNAVVKVSNIIPPNPSAFMDKANMTIHFNNGVTDYYENSTNWTDI